MTPDRADFTGTRDAGGSAGSPPKLTSQSQGKAAIKRNRFIRLSGGIRSVNRTLEARARALAATDGLNGLRESRTLLRRVRGRTLAFPPVIRHAPARLDIPRAQPACYRQMTSGVAAPDPGSGQVLVSWR
jgi:hypothetical protein